MPIRRYKSNDFMARYCQVMLKRTAYPSLTQLESLISVVNKSHEREYEYLLPPLEVKHLIKDWFRKRREYLSNKLYRIFDEVMTGWWEQVLAANDYLMTFDEVVQTIATNPSYLEYLQLEAKLPLENPLECKSFIQRRIMDYFYKLCDVTIQSE